MSRRRYTLDDYAYERTQQFDTYGAIVENVSTVFVDAPQRQVTIRAELYFGREKQALLDVLEIVVVRDDTVTRNKYSYHFQYRADLVIRFDRDPTAHEECPEHKHLQGQPDRRVPCDSVTLSDVVDYINDVLPDLEAGDAALRARLRWWRRRTG